MLWFLASALATPLVHDPGDSGATERAREAGIQDALEPLDLEGLRAAEPWSRNGQPLGPCTVGAIDAPAVRGHVLYGEFVEAHARLARERVRCDATPAARAELERNAGLLALAEGDAEAAAKAFAVAKGYDPALAWDADFPPDQQAVFDAAVPLVAGLLVVPDATVDGVPAGGPAAAGHHSLVVGGTSLYLHHLDIDDVVAVPSAYPDTLPSLADETARRDLTHVLSATLGTGERVHVAAPDALWTGTTGRTDWTPLPWPSAAVEEPEPAVVGRARRSPAPWIVAGAGGLAAIGGGLLMGLGYGEAQTLRDDMQDAADTRNRAAYEDLQPDLADANDRTRLGTGLAAGGAGILAVGLTWGVVR